MMKRTARLSFPGLACLLMAGPALANESHGLPQLNPHWYASQVFWLAVHFIALYFIAAKLILPRITETLIKRDGRIAGDIEQADRLQQEAAEARKAYEQTLAEAREQAHAVRQKSIDEARAAQVQAEKKMAETLAQRSIEANERIAKASTELQDRLKSVATDAAAQIIARLTNAQTGSDELSPILARVIAARTPNKAV